MKPFTYQGILYTTYTEAARKFRLNPAIVKRRLELNQPLELRRVISWSRAQMAKR